MDIVTVIFCWQTLVVALAASAIVSALKWSSDHAPKPFMDNKYVQMFLPIVPVGLAMLFSMAIRPDELQTIPQGLVWSLIPGFSAIFGWKLFRTLFMEKFGVETPEDLSKKQEKK